MRVDPRLAELTRRDKDPYASLTATPYALTGRSLVVTHAIAKTIHPASLTNYGKGCAWA
jgi:hypothetical protein